MSDEPKARITDPSLNRKAQSNADCEVIGWANGTEMVCWLDTGHDDDHYDVVDGSWVIEEGA